MKTILILIFLTISIFATQKEYVRDIPKNVVDVENFGLIESKDAFFLLGNEKYGIMKKSWAFADKEAAQKYAEKHGGCIVDYETYVKMDNEAIKLYVKEHGIAITKDTNTTEPTKKDNSKSNIDLDKYSKPEKKNNSSSGIFSKENLNKYK